MLFLIILVLTIVSGQKKDELWETKCHKTEVDEFIYDYNVRNLSLLYLPTLSSMKKLYPGDTFFPTKESACEDVDTKFCKYYAEKGYCIGSNEKDTEIYNKEMSESVMKAFQFHMKSPNMTSFKQISQMTGNCRQTCKQWIKDNEDRIKVPTELELIGRYEDVVTDVFGEKFNTCDMAWGNTYYSNDIYLSMAPVGFEQGGKITPRFTEEGFKKMKIPKKLYATILSNRKKLLKSGEKWQIEYCVPGLQSCDRIYESVQAQECHQVSAGNYWFLRLDEATKKSVFEQMRPLAEKWIGNKFELVGTSAYGLRKYTRGATLGAHVDKLDTHVISAILNIHQKVDEDWPLQILDHDGKVHHVILKPGEMVWYESAKLLHGRTIPLNGTSFENIFIHYAPAATVRGKWYHTNYYMIFGEPLEYFTLDTLIEDDKQMTTNKRKLAGLPIS